MHNYFLSKSPTTYLGLSGVGTTLVRLDDVDEVTVVTDTNESVEDDDVNDDKTELELLDDDDDDEEEENLSAGVSLPM